MSNPSIISRITDREKSAIAWALSLIIDEPLHQEKPSSLIFYSYLELDEMRKEKYKKDK